MSFCAKIGAVLLLVLAVGCQEVPRYWGGGRVVLAEAAGRKLYAREVKAAIPKGVVGEDSVAFVNRYVEKWVHKQLKLHEAEELFSDAEQDIETTGDNYIAGLIYTQMGDIYKHYCDYTKSFEAYSKSRDHYEKAGLIQHRNYALLEMGKVCLHTNTTNYGIDYLRNSLHAAIDSNDSTLIRLCLSELMIQYDASEEYIDAYEIFKQLSDNYSISSHTTYIIGTIAHILAANNKKDESIKYLEYGWSKSYDKADSTAMYFQSARVNIQFHNYKQAYIDYNKCTKLQFKLLQESLRQPIISAQKDYFRQKSERNHQRYTISKIVASTIAAFGIAISLAIVKYMRYRIRY